PLKLIQVIQGAAMCTMGLNVVALWKQETPRPFAEAPARPTFSKEFGKFLRDPTARRLLAAVGLGAAGFNMQDILLEPYGGELLRLSVSGTPSLTALLAAGTLGGLFFAARSLSRGRDAYLLAALGGLVGIAGFSLVIFSAPLSSVALLWAGTACIGF